MHRLARDLEAAGAPEEMRKKALAGHYDDFHPNAGAFAMTELHSDLRAAGLEDMAAKVADGEYDATKEESDAWAASPEGQETFAELTKGATSSDKLDQIAADHAIKRNNPLVNEGGRKLPLKHPEQMLAATTLLSDTGAAGLEVGFDEDVNGKVTWWAKAKLPSNDELLATEMRLPEQAVEAIARRAVEGLSCVGCEKPIRLGGDREGRKKVCRWVRIGPKWERGCR